MAVGTRLAPSVFGVDHVDQALHSDRLSYPFGYWNAVAAWGAMCIALGAHLECPRHLARYGALWRWDSCRWRRR